MELQATKTEERLLHRAIDKFTTNTGVKINVIAWKHPMGGGKYLDALADVQAAAETKTYAIEIKRHLTTAKLGLAAEQLKDTPYKGMLITDYVNPIMAERLKEMGLAFIDLAGNAYLNEPPVFVYIKGNRPTEERETGRNLKPTRAFQATGLKVIFGLLMKPDLLQKTYREIAEATDVALGTVGWVLTDLREHGYLYEGKERGRKLLQKRKIVEQWVTAYPEKLRPKLKLARYQAPKHRWWDDVTLNQYNAQWGGEIAAEMLTNYLVPEKATIYADKVPAPLVVEKRLIKDPDGDVEILQRFWKPGLFEEITAYPAVPLDVVPPLLIYADLMATAEDRNIETAKLIYEKFINGSFEKDR
jgi:hypothetical protein